MGCFSCAFGEVLGSFVFSLCTKKALKTLKPKKPEKPKPFVQKYRFFQRCYGHGLIAT